MKEELKPVEVDFEELGVVVDLGDTLKETRQTSPGPSVPDSTYGHSWWATDA